MAKKEFVLQVIVKKKMDNQQGKIDKRVIKYAFNVSEKTTLQDLELRIIKWGKQLENQSVIDSFIDLEGE